jgi:hypothetical protein
LAVAVDFPSSSVNVFQRLELKYPIDERLAERIRRDVDGTCLPDKFTKKAGLGYPLTSLYFDTASLAFHGARLRNDPDRFKLRARVYDDVGPVQLEVKRKVGEVIHKTRVAVARDGWAEAARGHGRPLEDGPRNRKFLSSFAHLLAQSGAEPSLLVHYDREAFVSTVDKYARVTFDRRVMVRETRDWQFGLPDWRWTQLGYPRADDARSFLILELKCESLMPCWMVEIIQRYQLQRSGYSKYSDGLRAARNAALCITPIEEWMTDG